MKKLLLLLLALLPMLVLAQGVTPFRYDTVQKFSDGTAIVVHNGKYGLIKMGKVIVPPEYKEIKRIADDKYLLTSNGLSIADSKGNIAHNVMIYTSYNGQAISPKNNFDTNIVSNTYSDGVGVIVFNKPVTSIGSLAFYDCNSLTSVTIPDSVTEIGENAFYNCTSLTSVTIPDSVTEIGSGAFSGCTSLTSVTIGNSVTSIGYMAFDDCTSLTSVAIPNSVTWIGVEAFYGCTSLPVIDGVRYAGTYLVEVVDKTRTSYSIKPGTRLIGNWAFEDCTLLTSITIPNSVTSIGESAFKDCTSLTSITIPNSVTEIWSAIFSGCTSLPIIDGIRYADTYLVEVVDKTRTSYTIKPGTRFIGSNAFKGCTSLTSVTIPNSVTSIGDGAFEGCASLTSVTIPNSITSIGNGAFSGCSSLTSIVIPNSVTEIRSFAFSDCTSLRSITIPDSVTEIGGYAFQGCYSLKEVYCKPMTPPTAYDFKGDWDAFSDNAPGRKIHVPRASVEAYKQAEYWEYYASDIVGYDF